MRARALFVCLFLACGCDGVRTAIDASATDDAASAMDGAVDAGARDGGLADASWRVDAAGRDASSTGSDSGGVDSGTVDSGRMDAGTVDSGRVDSGSIDSGTDAGPRDAGPPDAGGGDCISGATGTHAVRFRWAGSGPSSTAYVVYERNQLPDTTRWHVSAASRSIGYTPVFTDTFLGEGGLDLEGTVFIDVELSTIGLSSIRRATLSIYGRSFDTTASGSFEWQTFDGTGASPPGSVYNSAPYQWYSADATSELTAGDGSILLRITAGPPSNALIVNRVELCFDARP